MTITMRNLYCADCLRTQRFLDLTTHLICEVCSKRLLRTSEPSGGGISDEEGLWRGRAVPLGRDIGVRRVPYVSPRKKKR